MTGVLHPHRSWGGRGTLVAPTWTESVVVGSECFLEGLNFVLTVFISLPPPLCITAPPPRSSEHLCVA